MMGRYISRLRQADRLKNRAAMAAAKLAGEPKFIGVPCHCGCVVRRTKGAQCVDCQAGSYARFKAKSAAHVALGIPKPSFQLAP